MKKIIVLFALVMTSNLWAFIYDCTGGGYNVLIFNPEQMTPEMPALIITSNEGVSNVLAGNLKIQANFEIEVSGRTVQGNFVRYITMAIDDPGVGTGAQINGEMNLDTKKGNLNISLVCTKG